MVEGLVPDELKASLQNAVKGDNLPEKFAPFKKEIDRTLQDSGVKKAHQIFTAAKNSENLIETDQEESHREQNARQEAAVNSTHSVVEAAKRAGNLYAGSTLAGGSIPPRESPEETLDKDLLNHARQARFAAERKLEQAIDKSMGWTNELKHSDPEGANLRYDARHYITSTLSKAPPTQQASTKQEKSAAPQR